jgi:hypothetical protein
MTNDDGLLLLGHTLYVVQNARFATSPTPTTKYWVTAVER